MNKQLQNSSECIECSSNDDILSETEGSVKLRYRSDTLSTKNDICMALRINTGDFMKRWKRNREGRLSWHLCAFLGLVALRDQEQGTNHDILLSIYGLDHLGAVDPTYAEFKRFWAGKSLSDFFLIISAPEKYHVIGDAFTYYVREECFPVADVQEIPAIPRDAIPVYRLRKREICIYIEQIEFDPARGPQPCSVFLSFDKGWPGYGCYPLDPETCLSQDLAVKKDKIRPSMVVLESPEFGSLRAEMKQYKWKEPKK